MEPKVWGPKLWIFLHSVSYAYPENPNKSQKKHMKKFIKSLKHILPCPTCRKNLRVNMKELPLTKNSLSSRTSLIKWFVDLHNIVNRETEKPQLSYEEAQDCLLDLYV